MTPDPPAATPIDIQSRDVGSDVACIAINGSLDWSNFPAVEKAIDAAFQRGIYRILLDLRQAAYISSAGIGCFISSLDLAMRNGGNLVFLSPAPDVRDIFQILGLGKILRFAESEEQALEWLRGA